MQFLIDPQGKAVLENDQTRWPMAAIFLGLLSLGVSGYMHFVTHGSNEKAIGWAGVACTLLLAGVFLYEKSSFLFDREKMEIRWTRLRFFSRQSGTIPFSKVRDVVARTPIGDSGIPSRRVEFLTENGDIPVTVAYSPDHDDQCLKTVDQIRLNLGMPPLSGSAGLLSGAGVSRSVEALIESGRKIEAIKMLRMEKNLSLIEAKTMADDIEKKLKESQKP